MPYTLAHAIRVAGRHGLRVLRPPDPTHCLGEGPDILEPGRQGNHQRDVEQHRARNLVVNRNAKPEHRVAEVDEKHADGHQLQRGLDLSARAGRNDHALAGCDAAQASDAEVARDQDHDNPGRRASHRHEEDQHGCDHELVGQGIEELAQNTDLTSTTGQIAIEAIARRGDQVEDGRDETTDRAEVVDEVQDPRDDQDSPHRHDVGQVRDLAA